MKKCNECGQIINREFFSHNRRKKASRLIKISKLSKEQRIYNFLELLDEMKTDLINNPEKMTDLVNEMINEIENKK